VSGYSALVGISVNRPSSFGYNELIDCARGFFSVFGKGNAQLPLPPMLMFDRITAITDTGGQVQWLGISDREKGGLPTANQARDRSAADHRRR
jgi:hypothetical protein